MPITWTIRASLSVLWLGLALGFSLLIGGCSAVIPPALQPAPPSPTLTSTPATPLSVALAPTATRADPTYTRTPTLTPTLTRTPSVTPTFTPTPLPTLTRTPTRTPLPVGHITRIDTQYHSAALNEDRRIFIYLPPGYNESPQRRYPVLYLLHGYGGFTSQSTTEWEQWGLKEKAEAMIVSGQIQPVIIVQPSGFMGDGQPSYFFNHGPGTDGKRWGDAIWADAVNYVDANYRTLRQVSSRAIGGFSLGGQGALSLALLHPEVFKIVGGHSPSFRGADGSIPFIDDWNYFNQFDPIWLVENTDTGRQLTLWMDVGTDDDRVRNCGPGSNRCVEAFHELLLARGMPHDWHDTWPGPHEGTAYWGPHIPDYLIWYSSKLAAQ